MSVPSNDTIKMPPGHEPATKALVFAFIFCAGIWLLIGTSYGLLAAVKLFLILVQGLYWYFNRSSAK